MDTRPTRREVLGGAGMLAVVGAAAAAGACSSTASRSGATATTAGAALASATVPFFGAHQAGVTTPAQAHLVFAAFDLTSADRAALKDLLKDWTEAGEALTAGRPLGAVAPAVRSAAPGDSGEALGLPPARLTVTVGVGRSVFVDAQGHDRFGLGAKLPAALAPMPAFPGDDLDPTRSDGDLGVQICADDPTVAFHAFHNLTRLARGTAVLRWVQTGFNRAPDADPNATVRNLQGFKDGTNNIDANDDALVREHVWVFASDGAPWMQAGTYMVTRRIRMHLEHWDRSAISDQEETIGRSKVSGAPLGATAEHDVVPLTARGPNGKLVVPSNAHIRLAAASQNRGVRILRRGYNFSDGVDPQTGQLDAGLFFVAYQRDPRRQFVALQQRLSRKDALNEYITHTSTATFAVLPGADDEGFLGNTLLA